MALSLFGGNDVIQTIIQEIEQQFSPHFEPFLNPPATVQRIEEVEQKMGITFPDDVRTLYLTHDGEKDEEPGLFFGLSFLSLESMLAEWQTCSELSEDEELQQFESYSVPEDSIKEQYMNRYWIPIAHDHGGNYLGIDLDPDSNGIHGQVINFGRDETVKYVIARSITDLLAFIAQTLKNGTYTIDEETYWSYGYREEAHFFDELQHMALPVFHAKAEATDQQQVTEDVWFEQLSDEWKEIIQSLSEHPKQFVKRKVLYLMGKQIFDVTPLTVCTDVRELVLSGNHLTDIRPLQSLLSLKKLYLGGNPITDIASLAHLNKLQYLNLSRTTVKDLSPLESLNSLKELSIEHTPIHDYRPLQHVKKLHTLSVSILNDEQLVAITDLSHLKQLHIHQLVGVTEVDLMLFEKLKRLEALTIENCVFNDLHFLTRNPKLQQLTLVNSSIQDASSIKKMTALTHLECNNTPVENIEVIAESTSLKSFAGSFKQFYTLKKLMHQDVDFSKIIGDMTTEEKNIWYSSFDDY